MWMAANGTVVSNMLFLMVFCLLVVPSSSAVPLSSETEDGCERNCGNVSIPYPFGIGNDPKCYRDDMFKLFCNDTTSPNHPVLLFEENEYWSIQNIFVPGEMTFAVPVAADCYTENGIRNIYTSFTVSVELRDGYRCSDTRNKFFAIGCDTQAYIYDYKGIGFQSGCSSWCGDITNVTNETCTGIGCCEIPIPKGVASLNLTVGSFENHSGTWDFNPCSYGFLADENWYKFYVSDLMNFTQRLEYTSAGYSSPDSVPVVIDWAIGNVSCEEALQGDQTSYACGMNTYCSNSSNAPGYHCHCNQGYQGNPYLKNGCKDIDECKDSPCAGVCHNIPGNYTCSCPKGQHGDGTREGSGCKANTVPLVIKLTIGFGLGCLLLVFGTSWICCWLQQRKINKLKKIYYNQNGGKILEQKLLSVERSVEGTTIFTAEELKEATDNYHESRVIGQGGNGTVYKGVLPNGRIIAVKKSKVVDKEQIEQFINEVLILSHINHRNVVKLLGCCLETEVPLLVYEFINNGTLSHHIHGDEYKYSMSWSNRLRIAAETAAAIAYLHSSASEPIIHRDIKSTNILLDENYIAKVADFGASRLIALDQTQLSTLVQGTMGYLDPAYMHTSLLTDKSDVYSFGVVLVELLTGRKALCFEKPEAERNLAMYFVSSLKQNRLFEILDHQVLSEGNHEQLQEVANVARRCVRLDSEERPMMKEVAMELEGMRISEQHVWIDRNPEESSYFLGEQAGCDDSTSGYDSLKGQAMHSLHIGR